MKLDPSPPGDEARAMTRLPWLLPFGLLVFALVAVPLHLLDDAGLPRFRALRNELGAAREANAVLRRDVRALAETVDRLEHSYPAVEEIAREELGLVYDGEWVVITKD